MTQFADQASCNDFGFPFGFDFRVARASTPTFLSLATFATAAASFGFTFFRPGDFPFATIAFGLSVLFACLTLFVFFFRCRRSSSDEGLFFGFSMFGAAFAAFFAFLFGVFSLLADFAPSFGGPDFTALFTRTSFVFGFAFFAFTMFGAFAARMGPFGARREVLLTKTTRAAEAANTPS